MDVSLSLPSFTKILVRKNHKPRTKLRSNWIHPTTRLSYFSQLKPVSCYTQIPNNNSDCTLSKTNSDSDWSQDEIDAISALFARPTPPQTQRKFTKEREKQVKKPVNSQFPPKTRSTDETPTPKRHVRSATRTVLSTRSSFADRVRKNPETLISIAREISNLDSESDVSVVLDRWAPFLRKGSLSMTIRELGHMGQPDRALQTLCWAQKRTNTPNGSKPGPVLFPDDRVLSSAVEVLARFNELKIENLSELVNWIRAASRPVLESMIKGFIKAGKLRLARKIILIAQDNNRTLDPTVHAKLILAAGRTSDDYKLVKELIIELGEREDFALRPQDCTSIMKVCVKLGMYETLERLFDWYRQNQNPTVVMYTMVMYSRYCDKKYREGLKLVWEMEGQNCLFDLPAYRVVIRLCIALNDLERGMRYFKKLKEAGFKPSYDIYKDLIKGYGVSGRYAKCRDLRKELELGGLVLDRELEAFFLQLDVC
ncbi:hypothetical protein LUZ60_009417 [Juncus effusus]|nr:hypothetical protein LUZ60_009417 [Juncus effusus]